MSRKRGAPLGNQNAIKHGFYSVGFKAAERRLLDELPQADLAAELELIRVTTLRFLQSLNAQSDDIDLRTQISALRAVNLSAHSVVSLLRTQAITAEGRQIAAEFAQRLSKSEP